MDKRIVFHHVTGRLAGILQILGTCSQLPAGSEYPPSLHLQRDNQPVEGHHAGTKPRMILYREWAQEPTGSLNDFNPVQV